MVWRGFARELTGVNETGSLEALLREDCRSCSRKEYFIVLVESAEMDGIAERGIKRECSRSRERERERESFVVASSLTFSLPEAERISDRH